MKISENINELAKALAQFQEEIRNPNNTATNPQFRSKYAPLEVVINTIKPVLAKYKLSFIQSTGSEGENISVTTLLMHESGQWIESDPLFLPAHQIKKGGEKDFNAQGAGSSLTYARRYSLSAMLGLSSEDDDDGNGNSQGYKDSSSNPPKSSSQPTGGGLSDEEREKRRQEAIAKAQARTNNTTEANDSTDNGDANETPEAEKITPQQEKAIGNLLNVLARKKGINTEEFLASAISGFGATKLEEITSLQAKDVIALINGEMRNK